MFLIDVNVAFYCGTIEMWTFAKQSFCKLRDYNSCINKKNSPNWQCILGIGCESCFRKININVTFTKSSQDDSGTVTTGYHDANLN